MTTDQFDELLTAEIARISEDATLPADAMRKTLTAARRRKRSHSVVAVGAAAGVAALVVGVVALAGGGTERRPTGATDTPDVHRTLDPDVTGPAVGDALGLSVLECNSLSVEFSKGKAFCFDAISDMSDVEQWIVIMQIRGYRRTPLVEKVAELQVRMHMEHGSLQGGALEELAEKLHEAEQQLAEEQPGVD